MTDPADRLTAARRAIEADRPAEARALLTPLLVARPDWIEARFHLARAQAALGEAEAARASFDAALTGAPGEPLVWMEAALFAHASGSAKDLLRRARDASVPSVLLTMIAAAAGGTGARAVGQGSASKRDLAAITTALKARDARKVEVLAAPLLRARPGAVLWGMVGQARLSVGAGPQAVQAFRNGLRLEPYAVDLRLGLTRALVATGESTAALSEARQAARQAPAWADAQLVFGRLAFGHGLVEHADRAATAALSLAPGAEATLRLGAEISLARGRPAEALSLATRLKAKVPGRDLLIGRAAASARRTDTALEAFARGLGAAPQDVDLRIARAQLLQSLGRREEAEADLRTVLAQAPGNGLAARALAYGTRLAPDDAVVGAMIAALDAPTTGAEDRRLLHYALGRITEKSDPPVSFAHLRVANDATAAAFPHDPEADRSDLARLTGPDWHIIRDAPGVSAATGAPIFVTGLPRSGTTLVEAILSAHSDVRAGGELGVLGPILDSMTRSGDAISAQDLTQAGDAYGVAADAAVGGGDGRLLTDKSIHIFTRIGAALRVLPQARIVVVHRDPRDTGLSIWRNHFRDGSHRYAASMTGIADHIALFQSAVAFWRETLAPGAFHEIHYEALLDAPEAEARRLLAACDLAWEGDVLDFHRRAERVDTLSFDQVRQPLYSSSRGAWRDHADALAPLIDALADRDLLPYD